MTELILSARATSLPKLNSGFRSAQPAEIEKLLRRAEVWFGPRALLERDVSFRQIIPYIVLVNDGHILAYERAKHGSEARLHGMLSVGLGGHVGLDDAVVFDGELDIWQTILRAADRELHEELSGLDVFEKQWRGFVADGTTGVGKVHFGIVALFALRRRPRPKAKAVLRPRLLTLEAIERRRDELEPWSDMVLTALQSDPELAPQRR